MNNKKCNLYDAIHSKKDNSLQKCDNYCHNNYDNINANNYDINYNADNNNISNDIKNAKNIKNEISHENIINKNDNTDDTIKNIINNDENDNEIINNKNNVEIIIDLLKTVSENDIIYILTTIKEQKPNLPIDDVKIKLQWLEKKKNLVLKLLNEILKILGKNCIDNIEYFYGVTHEDLTNKKILSLIEGSADEIFKFYSRQKSNYCRRHKAKNYCTSFIRFLLKEIGYALKAVRTPTFVNNKKIFVGTFRIIKI